MPHAIRLPTQTLPLRLDSAADSRALTLNLYNLTFCPPHTPNFQDVYVWPPLPLHVCAMRLTVRAAFDAVGSMSRPASHRKPFFDSECD
jgi:hypothetical protein